jgi:signal transduction histidine kinase
MNGNSPPPDDHAETDWAIGSTKLIGGILTLLLCSTALAVVLFALVVPDVQIGIVLVGVAPFAGVYGASLAALRFGRPKTSAHIFIWGTIVFQFLVLLGAPQFESQALLSFVNVVLAAGFMLGRRWALAACIVCLISVCAAHVLDLGVLGSPAGLGQWMADIPHTPVAVLVGVNCTLLTTGGLTYIGLHHLAVAIDSARRDSARAECAAKELERMSKADAIRASRTELLGIMSREIVALRSEDSIAREVADTVTFVLERVTTIVVARDGRILALSGGEGVNRAGPWPTLPTNRLFEPLGRARMLTAEECSALGPLVGGHPPESGRLVGPHNSPVLLIVCGEAQRVGSNDLEWVLTAAANLLDAGIQRTRLEHTLSQSQRMDALGRLSAGIAHDFNNLLTSILGGVELARRRPGDARQVGIYLDGIQTSTERAAGLTHKLMAFTSSVPQQPKPVDVVGLVEGLFPTLRRAVEESIDVDLTILEDEAWVDADPIDLERILVNLVVNARQALPDAGGIEVGVEVRLSPAEPTEGQVPVTVMWVEDDGVGMPNELIDHAFEPFFTTRKETGAAGLGLSIVYGLVQAMGGEIFVASDPGEGSRFEVCIPCCARPAATTGAAVVGPGESDGRRILVVEDDEDVCATICGMLEVAGYEVVAASGAAVALQIIESDSPFSLVLSDVVMPEMGGFELYEALRDRNADVRMALVSGYAPPTEDGHADRPKLPLISKPFSLADLVRFVGAAIG